MNVVIIEDERLTAQKLRSMILRYDSSFTIFAELSSVEESVAWFRTSASGKNALPVDLIFMDIHLEDGDSFQIIKELDLKIPVIFVTAFDDYMVSAFKVNSIDYLLKPVNYEELVAAIEKYKSLKQLLSGGDDSMLHVRELLSSIEQKRDQGYKDRFMVTVGTKIRAVKSSSIAYFYLENGSVFMMTFQNMVLPVDFSLERLRQLMDPKEFFRINRQFIVSLNAIEIVHAYSAGKLKVDLVPKFRQDVFVSGDRIADFKDWLGQITSLSSLIPEG